MPTATKNHKPITIATTCAASGLVITSTAAAAGVVASISPSTAASSVTNPTTQRRRAQNRAAQRAFRERKEKHAKDLEQQLAALTTKYRSLETSHAELAAAYEKLRKTIELLTKEESCGPSTGGGGVEVLRKVLGILHAEVAAVKVECLDGGKNETEDEGSG
jgi:septal ring factor EnvC (AmiA/AmiB activator)